MIKSKKGIVTVKGSKQVVLADLGMIILGLLENGYTERDIDFIIAHSKNQVGFLSSLIDNG